MKRKTTIETIMNWWAKLTSIAIIGLFLYSIYLIIQIFLLPGSVPWWIYILPFYLLFALIYYYPFFYYGWSKRTDSHTMKTYTKILAIFYNVIALITVVISVKTFEDILIIIPPTLLMIPLIYYGWRKKK